MPGSPEPAVTDLLALRHGNSPHVRHGSRGACGERIQQLLHRHVNQQRRAAAQAEPFWAVRAVIVDAGRLFERPELGAFRAVRLDHRCCKHSVHLQLPTVPPAAAKVVEVSRVCLIRAAFGFRHRPGVDRADVPECLRRVALHSPVVDFLSEQPVMPLPVTGSEQLWRSTRWTWS